MRYGLRLSRQAQRYVQRVNLGQRRLLLDRFDELQIDPYSNKSKPLAGLAGLRSSRVGDLRVIFSVEDALVLVEVIKIGPRGDVYRNL